jgi:hypothetical protein
MVDREENLKRIEKLSEEIETLGAERRAFIGQAYQANLSEGQMQRDTYEKNAKALEKVIADKTKEIEDLREAWISSPEHAEEERRSREQALAEIKEIDELGYKSLRILVKSMEDLLALAAHTAEQYGRRSLLTQKYQFDVPSDFMWCGVFLCTIAPSLKLTLDTYESQGQMGENKAIQELMKLRKTKRYGYE